MKHYTKIPNEILGPSQLSREARLLYCILLKYCGKDEHCFPSQTTLASDMSLSDRHVRNLLNQLLEAGIIKKRRSGWNRANTYTVSKSLVVNRNGISYHLSNVFPFQEGNQLPPKSTYLKGKGKRSVKGLEQLRRELVEKRIKR